MQLPNNQPTAGQPVFFLLRLLEKNNVLQVAFIVVKFCAVGLRYQPARCCERGYVYMETVAFVSQT